MHGKPAAGSESTQMKCSETCLINRRFLQVPLPCNYQNIDLTSFSLQDKFVRLFYSSEIICNLSCQPKLGFETSANFPTGRGVWSVRVSWGDFMKPKGHLTVANLPIKIIIIVRGSVQICRGTRVSGYSRTDLHQSSKYPKTGLRRSTATQAATGTNTDTISDAEITQV